MSEILQVTEINAETGEVITRELTADEIAEREADAQADAALKAEREAAEAAREASIRKMAENSGLTEDEIEALF